MTYQLPSWAKDFSDKNIDDRELDHLIKIKALEGIRWLDLRFNKISNQGLELLCSVNLPELEAVCLFGNKCIDICEKYKTVGLEGQIIPKSIMCDPLVTTLEAKYGSKIWLHPIANYGCSFPTPENLPRLDPVFVENYEFFEETFEDEIVEPEETLGKLAKKHGELALKSIIDSLTSEEIRELSEIRSKMDALTEFNRQNTLVGYIVEGISRYLDAKLDFMAEEAGVSETKGGAEQLKKAENYLKTAIKTALDHYPRTQDIKK